MSSAGRQKDEVRRPVGFAGLERARSILRAPLRLLHSLHFKIAVAVTVTVVALSASYLAWDYRFYRMQLLSELEQSADSLSEVILSSLIRVSMLGNHPQLLQQAIGSIAAETSAKGILVIDGSGTVRFSADPALVGRRLDTGAEGCRECHDGAAVPARSASVRLAGRERLRTVTPVMNRAECHACHGTVGSRLGLLVVDVFADSVHMKLRTSRNEMLLKAGLTILAILLVLGIVMNRLVIARLQRLTAAAGILAQHCEGPAPRASEGHDEIGRLGASFNRMLDSLATYRRNVRDKERTQSLLLEKIVRVQEEERKRISRELHDHLGQSLSALLLGVQSDRGRPLGANGLAASIRKLIDEVHQMAWQMRPSLLDDCGLDCALARYIEDVSKRHGVDIDYQYWFPDAGLRLPDPLEVTLYRVAQEAITNVVRHSRATRASVVLFRRKQGISLLIEDNGCGFDLESPPNNGNRLGLVGIKERVTLCGGSCAIESVPGGGTTINVRIPLEERPACPSEC